MKQYGMLETMSCEVVRYSVLAGVLLFLCKTVANLLVFELRNSLLEISCFDIYLISIFEIILFLFSLSNDYFFCLN